MQIGAIESTWKRRFMIVVSFPVVLCADLWRQAQWTFGMAKGAWAKREPVQSIHNAFDEGDIFGD